MTANIICIPDLHPRPPSPCCSTVPGISVPGDPRTLLALRAAFLVKAWTLSRQNALLFDPRLQVGLSCCRPVAHDPFNMGVLRACCYSFDGLFTHNPVGKAD